MVTKSYKIQPTANDGKPMTTFNNNKLGADFWVNKSYSLI